MCAIEYIASQYWNAIQVRVAYTEQAIDIKLNIHFGRQQMSRREWGAGY